MTLEAAHASDLARRVAHRRHELDLTQAEVARRAGMTPDYLDYLEHAPAIDIPRGALIRLAGALETSVDALRGGKVDRPPGPGRAGPYPHLHPLSREECEAHLAGGGVGRLVFISAGVPLALPVNFRFLAGDVVFCTRPNGALAAAVGTIVGFEVDRIDEAMSEGWSVLLSGKAHLVEDPHDLEEVAALGIEAWPGGPRDAVVRIETKTVSGRRIRQGTTRSRARS